MKIGEKEVQEIQILTNENELIVSITDEDVIEKDGYKVVCVSARDYLFESDKSEDKEV